jgi:hypothetical protein
MKYSLFMYAHETVLNEHPFLIPGTDEFTAEVFELSSRSPYNNT